MHDNNTVQQLSDALNELLDAYDKLKNENTNLQQENTNKDNKISELELRNRDLEEQIEQLTDTTEQHTSEIDTMLGRIKTILDNSDKNQEAIEEEKEESIFLNSEEELVNIVESELSVQEQTTMDIDYEERKPSNSSEKEIDLGRMQSLLNGFNN
jgi:chromosome segregation ATPase